MSNYSDAVIAANPLFYFSCDEPSGSSLQDRSGNGNGGTLSGSYTRGAPGMSAATGYGVNFTGVSGSGIVVPHKAALNCAGDYAIEMVVRFTGSTYSVAFNKVDSAYPSAGPLIYLNFNENTNANQPGAISWRQSTIDADGLVVGGVPGLMLNDNQYRHYVFVRRGLSLEVWIDGEIKGSKTQPELRNVTGTNPIYLMRLADGSGSVAGGLDEVAYYNFAPSAGDIAARARLARDLWKLGGTATLDIGGAASVVVARDWTTHAHVAATVPASDGTFEMYVPVGSYDVTVFGPAGYQPITHGPVEAVAS